MEEKKPITDPVVGADITDITDPDTTAAGADTADVIGTADALFGNAAVLAAAECLAEIGRLDASVKTFDDLRRMDTYPAFESMVRRGYSMTDAFRLANFDRLRQQYADAREQAARNSIHSRSHLRASGASVGETAVVVPPDILARYRALNPEATDAEIRRHWEKANR